jgi:cyclic pyranopterin phosphate synthase
VRDQIPGRGVFGIIANESESFFRSCTRLGLSSEGYVYGCLSNARRQNMAQLLDLPSHQALQQLQKNLVSASADKNLPLQGETTVMEFIGG